MENTTESLENNIPTNPSGWQMIIKILIWIVIWLVFSMLILILFVGFSSSLEQAMQNAGNNLPFSPLVWLSFMAIALLTSIIWNIILSWIYNVIWNEDYYDIKVMSSSILTANLILIIPFLILYAFVGARNNMDYLFVVYWFHLFFSIFVSFVSMDMIKNPNYSNVYFLWNSFWFIISIMIFFMLYAYLQTGNSEKNILFVPPILWFSLIPFISCLFEKVYYKMYEIWSDFLYIPSINEVMVDEEYDDDINVEINN